MQTYYPALATLAAYLIGSLSFAVIVSRAMGMADPRSYGSGNPGATNVLRSGRKGAAVLTLVLDAFKGFLPVWLVDQFGPRIGLAEWTVALVGLAAFVGHLWPVFFRFRGGKGVATAAGVLLGLHLWLGMATIGTWVIIAVFFRYSSLAAIVSAVFAPFYELLFSDMEPAALTITVMSLLLIWRHLPNIQKLLNGTESKIGQRAGAGRSGRSRSAASSVAPPVPAAGPARRGHRRKHGAKL
ncbi:MAG: glycerol-3-phosphate 1-O-acyltransferase PlsY [Proteobacteria bacterium]|nr:glycerol-3-phosphate 1-O-acyltransferase PlsY [Pseudomonadota bacterium]